MGLPKHLKEMTTTNQIKNENGVWEEGIAREITFIVTKDCQLACKYCYLVGKNGGERMDFELAKRVVDYVLTCDVFKNDRSVVWDFIGGEPFLEIDLIDKICDYIKTEMFRLNHRWFNSYRFSFATNGINYHTPKVQEYIRKNHSHLSIMMTVDGTKLLHDMNRVYKDSDRGSYEDVVKNVPLWQSQFPNAGTKVTISHSNIDFIKDSVLHLFSLGIGDVNINCVFENVWEPGDDIRLENQLMQLADAIIDNDLYRTHTCSFFWEALGKPMTSNENWCGAGKMMSVDAAGNFYPCTRFAGYSGCPWCQGENYDAAETDTIFQRSTAICLMHKARVRANNYYWNKLFRKLEMQGLREEWDKTKIKCNTTIC